MGRRVAELLDEAGLNASYNEDVMPLIWRNASVNGTMNSTCALLIAKLSNCSQVSRP